MAVNTKSEDYLTGFEDGFSDGWGEAEYNLKDGYFDDGYQHGYDDGYNEGYQEGVRLYSQKEYQKEDTSEEGIFDYFKKVSTLSDEYDHINLLSFLFWSSLLSFISFCIAISYCHEIKDYESINTLEGLALFSVVFSAHTILLLFFGVTNIENYSYISDSIGTSFLHGLVILVPCILMEGCILFLLLVVSVFMGGSSDPLKVFCLASYAILALFIVSNFLDIVQKKHYYSVFPIFSQLIALLIPSIVVWYKHKKKCEYDYLYK